MATFDSAPAIVGSSTATAYLHVDSYRDTFTNSFCIESPSIEAGGCSWRIRCYPHGLDDFIRREDLEASEHLAGGDCFTVRCDISVERAPQLSHLHRRLPVADVVFQAGGETFYAHGCVLAPRAPAFAAELSGVAAEGSIAGGCIRIDDMLPQVFRILLQFVYTDTLPEMMGQEQSSMILEHLIVVSDKYDLPGLKLICEDELSEDISEDNVGKMLRLAEEQHCDVLMEACIEFLEDPPVLEAAMASDDSLLELVARNCPVLLKEMFAYEDDPMQEELIMRL